MKITGYTVLTNDKIFAAAAANNFEGERKKRERERES
jgi:hypothetical protein